MPERHDFVCTSVSMTHLYPFLPSSIVLSWLKCAQGLHWHNNTVIAINCANICYRVFGQDIFPEMAGMDLSCIQFGYWMMGSTPTSVAVYIDTDGGVPNAANLQLLYSFPVTTVNAVGQMQVQTVTAPESISINFANAQQTLVVVLTVPVMDEGLMKAAGQFNGDVVGTSGETYVGGACQTEYVPYSTFAADNGENPYDAATQWYVRVHTVESTKKKSNNDNDDLSSGEIAGIVIGSVVGLAAIGAIVYFVLLKKSHAPFSESQV